MSTPQAEIEVQIGAEVGDRAQVAPDGTRITSEEVKVEVGEAPKAETPPKKDAGAVVTPEEGLKKLKKQLEDETKRADTERAQRLAAESRAREASEAAASEKNRSQATELDLVKGAISSLTQANDALEEKYAAALASQDYPAAAKAQREMSQNEARIMELNRGKTQMENAPKATPRVELDPVEQICKELTPQSAAWVRMHPEFAIDKTKNESMVRAHYTALGKGLTPDTPAYFSDIEGTLKITAPQIEVHDDDDPTAHAAKETRQVAPPAAPVSRSGNGTGGARPQTVRLTPEQVEMAKAMDMTPEEYAKQLLALKKEGVIH